jgi:hypothetical protein
MLDNWKLEGDYFESRNCDAVCPCVWLERNKSRLDCQGTALAERGGNK